MLNRKSLPARVISTATLLFEPTAAMSSAELSCLTHLLKLAAKPFSHTLKCLNNKTKNKNETNKHTVQLPLELQSEILSWLSAKQVTRYQCVCKTWRDEISSTRFINSRTLNKSDKANYNTNSYILLHSSYIASVTSDIPCDDWYCLDFSSPQTLEKKLIPLPRVPKYFYFVVGSCNGLICFWHYKLRFSICNVATGSLISIESCVMLESFREHDYAIGFGYDSTTDDFKILCVVSNRNEHSVESWVYSLNTNSWKSIHNIDYYEVDLFSMIHHESHYMIFSNNALHWIHTGQGCITCFDLGTEKYHKIVLPPYSDLWLSPHMKLIDLRGCLHLVRYRWVNEETYCYEMKIWVMTKDRVQWTELIRIKVNPQRFQLSSPCHKFIPLLPYAYSKDGKKILFGLGNPVKTFVSCELNSGRLTEFKVPSMLYDKFIAMPFNCFSLFSPNPSK